MHELLQIQHHEKFDSNILSQYVWKIVEIKCVNELETYLVKGLLLTLCIHFE